MFRIFPLFFLVSAGLAFADPVRTVASVDLKKYAGTWYEIARMPLTYEESCVKNTKAIYTLRDDGRMAVHNECVRDNGTTKSSYGLAKSVSVPDNSKLKVSFFGILGFHLFWGDYWIIDLDRDYRYAVVGEPDRSHAWVLSRTPQMPQMLESRALSALEREGFNTADLIYTPQDDVGEEY